MPTFTRRHGRGVRAIRSVAVESRRRPAPDLSSLLKADLVELAEKAGIDTTGATKAEIIDALQGATDGDVNQDT